MAEVLGSGTSKLTLALADVFAEESEQPFYGFSDNELSDHCDTVPNSHLGDEAEEALPGLNPSEKTFKPSSEKTKPSTGGRVFRLRVALRSAPISKQQSTDEDEEEEEESSRAKKRPMEQTGNKSRAKKIKLVKFEDEETAVGEERGSDSAEEEDDSFLAKRQKNIKDNKAMLAQLMADLNKMPGGVGILKKEAGKQKTKGRSARPPRSGAADGESRRNPERASRRQTRSMAGGDGPSAPKDEEMELSLEEELLEVRRAPQRRGAPRPNQSKPHVIRPVDDITEDELQLIADNTTEKVYNRVTGSTCHQCRQKTIDTKTCCRSEECRGIVGQFCGPCLKNRYGEEVKTALLDPEWKCPPCRGICNCSFCRTREGRCPTGILFPLAQYHGFSDVHSYLSSLRNKLKSDDNDVEL